MLQFNTTIKKFAQQGEKTGWTYIEITQAQANKLKKDCKQAFRVKGTLDKYEVKQVALIPMGGGSFILPLKGEIRKALGKNVGATLFVKLQEDTTIFELDSDFIEALSYEEKAEHFFKTLAPGHQRYFSKWIQSAKTTETKAKRIALAINALANEMGYGPMIRKQTEENKILGKR